MFVLFVFQAEDGIRDLVRSRGLGDVYKRQAVGCPRPGIDRPDAPAGPSPSPARTAPNGGDLRLSLIHI